MNTTSQNKQVLKRLQATGEVSRNWALRRLITRLASRILDLEKEGLIRIKDRGTGRKLGKRRPQWKDYFYKVGFVSKSK